MKVEANSWHVSPHTFYQHLWWPKQGCLPQIIQHVNIPPPSISSKYTPGLLCYFDSTIFITEVLPFSSLGILNPTCSKFTQIWYILQVAVGQSSRIPQLTQTCSRAIYSRKKSANIIRCYKTENTSVHLMSNNSQKIAPGSTACLFQGHLMTVLSALVHTYQSLLLWYWWRQAWV